MGLDPGAGVAVGLARFLYDHGLTIRGLGGGLLIIRPSVTPSQVVFALVVCVAGTIAASAGPALRASRLRPVEALTSP